jgi:hypothetical protein
MARKAGDLDPGGDEVLLEVRGHGDGWAEPSVTLRTPGESLLNDTVDVGRGGTGHARMPGLLAGPLEAPEEGRQTRGLTFRGVEALGEPLDFLLELRDLALLLVDERDELGSREALEIGDDGQRPSLSPGLLGTV